MKVAKSIAGFRAWRKTKPDRVVLVPTMGALHAGHAALIRSSRKLAGPGGVVAVSIFVNPTQFGPKEDFSSYPRPFRNDLSICRSAGADAVFAPPVEELYAGDASVTVDESHLSQVLCGRSRPGHFRGVCTSSPSCSRSSSRRTRSSEKRTGSSSRSSAGWSGIWIFL